MKPIYLLAISLLIFGIIIVSCNKNEVSAVYQTDVPEARQWLRENGGVFKKGELQINLFSGEKITGTLMWEEAKRLSYKGRDYIDIPYVFPQYEKILPGDENMPPISYNLVLRKNKKGEYEGALRTTQYGVMAENLTKGGEQPAMLQSYQSMDGKPLNMWLGDEVGENYKVAEEINLSVNQIAEMRAKAKMAITKEGNTVARRAAPDCEAYLIDYYETNFYYANAYDESIGNVTVQRIHRTITMTVCHPGNDFNSDYYMPVTGSEGGGGNPSSPEESNTPNFQLSKQDQQSYPNLTKMIRNLKNYVSNNSKVLKALLEYTGYSKDEILAKLGFGKGPVIEIKEMKGQIGHFERSTNKIELSAAYVRGLEQSSSRMEEAASFLLAVTALHEFVHYARHNNNLDSWLEYGWGFEEMAYGVIINKTNAYEYSINFYKKLLYE